MNLGPVDVSACGKCGSDLGWTGPIYRSRWSFGNPGWGIPSRFDEWLAFSCVTCGYERSEPTKDAPLLPPILTEKPPVRGWWARWFLRHA